MFSFSDDSLSHKSRNLTRHILSRVSSRPLSFLALFLTFCVRLLPWYLKKCYILPFFNKNKCYFLLCKVFFICFAKFELTRVIGRGPNIVTRTVFWHWFSFIRDLTLVRHFPHHLSYIWKQWRECRGQMSFNINEWRWRTTNVYLVGTYVWFALRTTSSLQAKYWESCTIKKIVLRYTLYTRERTKYFHGSISSFFSFSFHCK